MSSIYDDPSNFYTSADTHPRHLSICSATKGTKDLDILQECPNFAYEGDLLKADENVYCKHCWALGFYSVCDNNPKRVEDICQECTEERLHDCDSCSVPDEK